MFRQADGDASFLAFLRSGGCAVPPRAWGPTLSSGQFAEHSGSQGARQERNRAPLRAGPKGDSRKRRTVSVWCGGERPAIRDERSERTRPTSHHPPLWEPGGSDRSSPTWPGAAPYAAAGFHVVLNSLIAAEN